MIRLIEEHKHENDVIKSLDAQIKDISNLKEDFIYSCEKINLDLSKFDRDFVTAKTIHFELDWKGNEEYITSLKDEFESEFGLKSDRSNSIFFGRTECPKGNIFMISCNGDFFTVEISEAFY